MYISKLELTNIKCFDAITIDFFNNNDVCKLGVILGDNGLGKTTILRSIAMSLCGKASVSGLMDELYGDWIKKGKRNGSILLELKSENRKKPYSIKTTFTKVDPDWSLNITQKTDPVNFPWYDFFVCGYGASRGIIGDKSYYEYSVTDSTYSLFNYREPLQNPELIIRRILDVKKNDSVLLERKILEWIERILMLPKRSIKLDKAGLTVSGPWGKPLPLLALGDGHQATATWIVDMLGWVLFYDDSMFKKDNISGIVIVDEIEQHLHPIWQRRIIRLLKNVFPNIQFILTSHSPLVAGNASRLLQDNSISKMFYLKRDGSEKVQVSEIEENLGELNFDQILSSEAFGHIYNINPDIEDILREASILAAKDNRTVDEEDKYNNFKEKLKEIMFPEGRTLIERIVERDYYKDLEKEIEDFKKILYEKRK